MNLQRVEGIEKEYSIVENLYATRAQFPDAFNSPQSTNLSRCRDQLAAKSGRLVNDLAEQEDFDRALFDRAYEVAMKTERLGR